jgi:TRAP-type C4-dicarboxylate transport system permease small subunit
MGAVLGRVNDLANLLTRVACALLGAGIFAFTFAQVFFRYVLNSSLLWAEEVGIYAMVWLTFLGSSLLLRDWGHIGITVLLRKASDRVRVGLVFCVEAAVLVFLLFLAYYGTTTAIFGFSRRSPSMGFSTWWLKLSIPVGAVLMTLNLVEWMAADLRAWRRGDVRHFERFT